MREKQLIMHTRRSIRRTTLAHLPRGMGGCTGRWFAGSSANGYVFHVGHTCAGAELMVSRLVLTGVHRDKAQDDETGATFLLLMAAGMRARALEAV